MVAMSAFSGLVSSACALARAAAIAPIVSLERCIAVLRLDQVKAHRPRFRAFRLHPMTERLLGVLRDEALEFGLGFLVIEKGLPGGAEDRRELGPGVRAGHVDDAHRRKPRARRGNPEQARGLALLDTAPELALGGDEEVLVKGIG